MKKLFISAAIVSVFAPIAAFADCAPVVHKHAHHPAVTVTTDDQGNRTVMIVDHFACDELGCKPVTK